MLRPKRVFWIDNDCTAAYLDMALETGQCIEHIFCTDDGVLVVTNGRVSVQASKSEPPNDRNKLHRAGGAADDPLRER